MPEPAYSFSIPSLHDRTPLDCRVYHPRQWPSVLTEAHHHQHLRTAIVAHPYAPLGGCFDDAVVLSITQLLLEKGYVVGTFNFRGAAGSSGSTSLTGRAEQADYDTFIGFIVAYCRALLSPHATGKDPDHVSRPATAVPQDGAIELVVAGYSYGSLVLARLQDVCAVAQRFRESSQGTVEGDIVSQATSLAADARRRLGQLRDKYKPQESTANDSKASHRKRLPSVTTGEEQAHPGGKSLIRTLRRSTEMNKSQERGHDAETVKHDRRHRTISESCRSGIDLGTTINARYLLISPVVLPFTHSLCPPGSPFSIPGLGRSAASFGTGWPFLSHPTLAVFGNKDAFTSSHRLRGWAEKQSRESRSTFEWAEIEGAGHFWSEGDAMLALRERVVAWVQSGTMD